MLTARVRRIVDQITGGGTTPRAVSVGPDGYRRTELFISPKTVEHHVARIRQKLGVATRAELLAALRERH